MLYQNLVIGLVSCLLVATFQMPSFSYFKPLIGIACFVGLFVVGMIALDKFKKYKEH